MRIILPLSLAVLLLVLLLPLFLVSSPEAAVPVSAEQGDPNPAPTPYSPESENQEVLLDEHLILRVLLGEEVHEMTMAEFLEGVVAAEMPARFHQEALRAQAVAARTYTLHRMLVAPTPRHPEAYVCGSYACCKAFHSPERLRERWGDSFEYYRARIVDSVRATDGMILLYDERPILAAFHAASYGFTETSGAIWGSVPYLQSVRSFESEADVPRFYETVTMSFAEFRDIAQQGLPGTVLDENHVPYWITDLRHTESGRVESLAIGGVRVTGPEFRRLFGLRSTAVQFSFGPEELSITTGGHGHGVGMSQFGANTMANLGLDYGAILDWYYTGVTMGRMDSLFGYHL